MLRPTDSLDKVDPSTARQIGQPEYLSAHEWADLQAAKRKRRRKQVGAIASSAFAVAGVVLVVPPILRTLHLKSLAASIKAQRHYHCVVWRLGADGAATKLREDFVDGSRRRVDYWGGKVIYLHSNGDWLFDRATNQLRQLTAWAGTPAPMSRVLDAVQNRASRGFRAVEKLATSSGEMLKVSTEDAISTIDFDDKQTPRSFQTDRLGYRGWFKSMSISFDYGPTPESVFDAKSLKPNESPGGPFPKPVRFQVGDRYSEVIRADKNAEGVYFLLVRVRDETVPVVRDSNGMICPAGYAFQRRPDTRSHILMVLPSGAKGSNGAITAHYEFLGNDRTNFGDVELNVPHPTCEVVPGYLVQRWLDDSPLFDYNVRKAEILSDYWNRVMRGPKHEPITNFMLGAIIDPEDRIKSADHQLQAILCRLDEGEPRADTAGWFEARWHSIYETMKGLERRDEAVNALINVRSLIERFPNSYDLTNYQALQGEMIRAGLPPMPASWG